MMSDGHPQTLLQAVQYFADEEAAIEFVAELRWPDGEQSCPKCGSVAEHYFMKTRKRWKCRDCRHQFSVKVGTVFEGSPIKLSKWMPAVWMLANSKNGISSYELARALGVTQKTAWFMLHRIREAMKDEDFFPMEGEVEVDETYIGGKAKNMHLAKRKRVIVPAGWVVQPFNVRDREHPIQVVMPTDLTGKEWKMVSTYIALYVGDDE